MEGEEKKARSNKKYYKLAPGDTKDYNVRYENLIREQNQRQRQKNKTKKKNWSYSVEMSMNIMDNASECSS